MVLLDIILAAGVLALILSLYKMGHKNGYAEAIRKLKSKEEN